MEKATPTLLICLEYAYSLLMEANILLVHNDISCYSFNRLYLDCFFIVLTCLLKNNLNNFLCVINFLVIM